MLEQKIEELTAALKANTAALLGKKPAATEAAAAEGKKGPGRPAGSKGKGKEKEEVVDDDGLGEDDDSLGLGDDDGLGDEPEISQEDVVASFKALKSSHGVDVCRAVLKELGQANVLTIPEEEFAKALATIKKHASKKK